MSDFNPENPLGGLPTFFYGEEEPYPLPSNYHYLKAKDAFLLVQGPSCQYYATVCDGRRVLFEKIQNTMMDGYHFEYHQFKDLGPAQ